MRRAKNIVVEGAERLSGASIGNSLKRIECQVDVNMSRVGKQAPLSSSSRSMRNL